MAGLRSFQIVIHTDAEDDLDQIVAGIALEAPLNAGRFAHRLADRIRSLEKLPARCPRAREIGQTSHEIRQLLVGRYRVIFAIRARTMHVLRVIHTSRDALPQGQLPDPT